MELNQFQIPLLNISQKYSQVSANASYSTSQSTLSMDFGGDKQQQLAYSCRYMATISNYSRSLAWSGSVNHYKPNKWRGSMMILWVLIYKNGEFDVQGLRHLRC